MSTFMAEQSRITIAVIGIDIGKYSCHVVGLDQRDAIALRAKYYQLFSGRSLSAPALSPPVVLRLTAPLG
jgi:hypothetical protein